jgi:hypothetical protein
MEEEEGTYFVCRLASAADEVCAAWLFNRKSRSGCSRRMTRKGRSNQRLGITLTLESGRAFR